MSRPSALIAGLADAITLFMVSPRANCVRPHLRRSRRCFAERPQPGALRSPASAKAWWLRPCRDVYPCTDVPELRAYQSRRVAVCSTQNPPSVGSSPTEDTKKEQFKGP